MTDQIVVAIGHAIAKLKLVVRRRVVQFRTHRQGGSQDAQWFELLFFVERLIIYVFYKAELSICRVTQRPNFGEKEVGLGQAK